MRPGRRVAWLGILAIAFFFSVQISGCAALLGTVIGASVDSGKPTTRVIPPGEALEVSPGARVTFQLRNGTSASGRYLGVGAVSDEEYARRYQTWRDSLADGESFPALGDSIQLNPRHAERQIVEFAGFGYRHVVIRSRGGEGYGGSSFETLLSISGPAGDPILVERLIGHDVSGTLPSRTALRVLSGHDTLVTALDQIVDVNVGVPRHGARNGFLIGLAADVILFMVAAATYEPPSSDCDTSGLGQDYSWFEEPFDTWTGRPLSRSEWAAISTAADSAWVLGAGEPVVSATVPDASR